MLESIGAFFVGIGAFFILGSVSFWAIAIVSFLLMTWCTEEDHQGTATFLVFTFVTFFALGNGIPFEPAVWLKYFVCYLVIGAVYSFVKWISFLFKTRDELKDHKAAFAKQEDLELVDGKIPPNLFGEFAEFLKHTGYLRDPNRGYYTVEITKPKHLIPTVQNNIGRLTRWIVWWPFSAFWTFLNDPLTRLARWFVQLFKGFYTSIAEGIFKNEI